LLQREPPLENIKKGILKGRILSVAKIPEKDLTHNERHTKPRPCNFSVI
jgi:hypothetical protein